MSKLGSGTAKVMVGQIIAMGVGIFTAPLVGRLFSQEAFGVSTLIESVVIWVTAFAGLGYTQAIPLSSSRGETRALVRLCLWTTLLIALPIVLLVFFGGGWYARVNEEPALKALVWFVPAIFLIDALRQTMGYVFSREQKYGWVAAVSGLSASVARLLQIVLGFALGGSALFLLIGTTVGGVLGLAIPAVVFIPLMLARSGRDTESGPRTMRAVASVHSQFPRIQMWNRVLNISSQSLPVWLMGALFSTQVLGLYGWGRKLVTLPLSLLGVSIAQVFYPEAAAEWRETGSAAGTIHRTVRILAITCIFPLVALGALGPMIFEVFLGPGWREGGVYAQILCPWMLVTLFSSPLSPMFMVASRCGKMMFYNILLMTLRPLALVVGSALAMLFSPWMLAVAGVRFPQVEWLWSGASRLSFLFGDAPRMGILLFSAVGLILQAATLSSAVKLGKARRREIAALCVREVAIAAAMLAPACAAYWLFGQPVVSLALLAVGGLLHGVVLLKREPAVRTKVMSIVARAIPGKKTPAENSADVL